MRITTRRELAEYCLRRLGEGVIEINVSEEQVEDRIQDAIDMWHQYHFDGSERTYMKLNVVASTLTFNGLNANNFLIGEKITGETSGATAEVYKIRSGDTLDLKGTVGVFVDGETVTGELSGAAFTLAAANAFVLGNWDRGYFAVPDNVLSISRVFPIGQSMAGGLGNNSVFNIIFQLRANETLGFIQSDLTYYHQFKTHLSLIDMLLPSERSYRFNRRTEKLYVDTSWESILDPEMTVLVEAHVTVDPDVYLSAYNDMFLKKYATLLIKKQWASNLSKFEGVKLPGGVTMNGAKLYQEAMDEIEKLEDEIRITWETPSLFFTG